MYSSQVLWPSWSISIWVLIFFLDKVCKPHDHAISGCLPCILLVRRESSCGCHNR